MTSAWCWASLIPHPAFSLPYFHAFLVLFLVSLWGDLLKHITSTGTLTSQSAFWIEEPSWEQHHLRLLLNISQAAYMRTDWEVTVGRDHPSLHCQAGLLLVSFACTDHRNLSKNKAFPDECVDSVLFTRLLSHQWLPSIFRNHAAGFSDMFALICFFFFISPTPPSSYLKLPQYRIISHLDQRSKSEHNTLYMFLQLQLSVWIWKHFNSSLEARFFFLDSRLQCFFSQNMIHHTLFQVSSIVTWEKFHWFWWMSLPSWA